MHGYDSVVEKIEAIDVNDLKKGGEQIDMTIQQALGTKAVTPLFQLALWGALESLEIVWWRSTSSEVRMIAMALYVLQLPTDEFEMGLAHFESNATRFSPNESARRVAEVIALKNDYRRVARSFSKKCPSWAPGEKESFSYYSSKHGFSEEYYQKNVDRLIDKIRKADDLDSGTE
jgi:hypothetical protein